MNEPTEPTEHTDPAPLLVAPSRQEMFARAVKGLFAQGWQRSTQKGLCLYVDGTKRCAWGHVDPEHTVGNRHGEPFICTVTDLALAKIGIAGLLSPEDLAFARRLQRVHDTTHTSLGMKLDEALCYFMRFEGLSWPFGVPFPFQPAG